MIVSEFIEWLKTQDQGATVEVLQRVSGGLGYGGDDYMVVVFDPEKHAEYVDFRKNQYAAGKPYENDRNLFLGET